MNRKLSCLIIDDEKNGRDVIRNLINSYCPEIDIVGEAPNIEQAAKLIELHQPDFVLLDIQMPGGNGFELLKNLNAINFEIIFVSSYDKYAIQAFKFSAIDYLLKPVEIDDLLNAIERVSLKVNKNLQETKEKYIRLLQNINEENDSKNLAVQKGEKVFYVSINEILMLEAESNYCHLTTITNENFILSKTLKYYEDLFHSIPKLVRVSRSHIVNTEHIKSYSKPEPCIITLSNGKEIEIGRRKKTELINLIKTLK